MRRQSRLAVTTAMGVGAIALVSGTAFTAGNTVTSRSYGQGVGVVSGFQVSNVRYSTNSDTPDPRITLVSFTIQRADTTTYSEVLPENATVQVRLDVNGTYSTTVGCTIDPSGNAADCAVSTLNARSGTLKGVSVIAYDTAAAT